MYFCNVCHLAFASEKELSEHDVRHHGVGTSSALRPPTLYEQLDLTPPSKRARRDGSLSQCVREHCLSSNNFGECDSNEIMKLWEISRAASPTVDAVDFIPRLSQVIFNDIEEPQQFSTSQGFSSSQVKTPKTYSATQQVNDIMGDPFCLHELGMTETEAEYSFRRLDLSESEVEEKMRTFRKLSSPAAHQYNATQQVNDIMQDPFCLHAFQLSESEAMFHLRELGLSETEIENKMCNFRELPPHQSNNTQVGRGIGNNEPLHQSEEIPAGENEVGEDYILENNDGRFNEFLERNHNAIFREPLGNRRQTFLNYNFRQMPINRESLYIRLFQILAEGYVFRINLAEAYVLEHAERLELWYFYACPGNTSIIPEAATIRSIRFGSVSRFGLRFGSFRGYAEPNC
uniref:uncharacterized protein LOC113475493 n=1 Tax=Ciona intestinalis TaxID=7719 RepID=UPI000EF53C62|nr:uncharacterized protein LOC113475493 [Ciona intestinalis]|eukprot:XP_026695476.1 uncharacterized protein LOC113475493 [Ciona intestinalis]